MPNVVSELSIAQDLVLAAVRDLAHDLMGCMEALEEHAESNRLSVSDHESAAHELSEEFSDMAKWLEDMFRAGAFGPLDREPKAS